MIALQRYETILQKIQRDEVVTLADLQNCLSVSGATVRRDIERLEARGLLQRVRGGVCLPQRAFEANIIDKKLQYAAEKARIGAYAASFVAQGTCIFMDSGTTTAHMIPFLQGRDIRVVTNGIMHIELLMQHHIKTYLTGGMMKPLTGALVGEQALETLEKYSFDQCFLGTNGIHLKKGFTTPTIEEAAIKKLVLENSGSAFVLTDHSKFNTLSLVSFAPLNAATIITERTPSEAFLSHTTIKLPHA